MAYLDKKDRYKKFHTNQKKKTNIKIRFLQNSRELLNYLFIENY